MPSIRREYFLFLRWLRMLFLSWGKIGLAVGAKGVPKKLSYLLRVKELMIGMGKGLWRWRTWIVLEGRGVEQITGRPEEGWTTLEPAYVGTYSLAVLPVLIEYSFLDGFLAAQNKSWESRWLHWKMAGIWQGKVARRECQPPAGTQDSRQGNRTYWLPISFAVLEPKRMGDSGLSFKFCCPLSVWL